MHYIIGIYFFSRWPEITVGDIVWKVLKLRGRLANLKWMKCFIFFCFFISNALGLNNQKILCLPSTYEFERTGTNLNHPTPHLVFVVIEWPLSKYFLHFWNDFDVIWWTVKDTKILRKQLYLISLIRILEITPFILPHFVLP